MLIISIACFLPFNANALDPGGCIQGIAMVSNIQEYSTILYIANGSTFVLQQGAHLRSSDLFGLIK